jgi:hypothetical protein
VESVAKGIIFCSSVDGLGDVAKGLAFYFFLRWVRMVLLGCAKRFFKINFDFELGVLKGFAP